MRQLFIGAVALAGLSLAVGSAEAGKVEMKGPHLCCAQCVKVVNEVLSKVEGVADVKADQATKTVTFTGKDAKATAAGIKALVDAGFFGTATEDGKEIKVEADAPKKGEMVNELTIKAVHVCCGQCQKALANLFQGSTVSFGDGGPQKDVKITGKGLERAAVVELLRKTGFNGKVD